MAIPVADIRGAFNTAISELGIPAVLHHAKGGADVNIKQIGFATVGKSDEALINAYGIGAKVFTFKAADVAVPPQKFDTVTVGAEVYTLEASHPIHLAGNVIGYKCFARGKAL